MLFKKNSLPFLIGLFFIGHIHAQNVNPITAHIELMNDSIWFSNKLNNDSSNHVFIKYKIHITNHTDSNWYIPYPEAPLGDKLLDTYLYHKEAGLIKEQVIGNGMNTFYEASNSVLLLRPKETYTINQSLRFVSTHQIEGKRIHKDNYAHFYSSNGLFSEIDSLHHKAHIRLQNGIYQLFAVCNFNQVHECLLDLEKTPNYAIVHKPILFTDTAVFAVYGDYPTGITLVQGKSRNPLFPGGSKALHKAICLALDTMPKRILKSLKADRKYSLPTFTIIVDTNGKAHADGEFKKIVDELPLFEPALKRGIKQEASITISFEPDSYRRSYKKGSIGYCGCYYQPK